MTKSFDSSSLSNQQDLRDQLSHLMENKGLSLIQAAQKLDISFKLAKSILLTSKSSRTPPSKAQPISEGFSPLAICSKQPSCDTKVTLKDKTPTPKS